MPTSTKNFVQTMQEIDILSICAIQALNRQKSRQKSFLDREQVAYYASEETTNFPAHRGIVHIIKNTIVGYLLYYLPPAENYLEIVEIGTVQDHYRSSPELLFKTAINSDSELFQAISDDRLDFIYLPAEDQFEDWYLLLAIQEQTCFRYFAETHQGKRILREPVLLELV